MAETTQHAGRPAAERSLVQSERCCSPCLNAVRTPHDGDQICRTARSCCSAFVRPWPGFSAFCHRRYDLTFWDTGSQPLSRVQVSAAGARRRAGVPQTPSGKTQLLRNAGRVTARYRNAAARLMTSRLQTLTAANRLQADCVQQRSEIQRLCEHRGPGCSGRSRGRRRARPRTCDHCRGVAVLVAFGPGRAFRLLQRAPLWSTRGRPFGSCAERPQRGRGPAHPAGKTSIGSRLVSPRKRRSRQQAPAIGTDVAAFFRDRLHPVGVEHGGAAHSPRC